MKRPALVLDGFGDGFETGCFMSGKRIAGGFVVVISFFAFVRLLFDYFLSVKTLPWAAVSSINERRGYSPDTGDV
jgi:hypothetical protein